MDPGGFGSHGSRYGHDKWMLGATLDAVALFEPRVDHTGQGISDMEKATIRTTTKMRHMNAARGHASVAGNNHLKNTEWV